MDSTDVEWPGYSRKSYDTSNRPKRKGRRAHREKSQTAPFIGWDGEGYSTDDGDHHYMLFGNSLGESVKGKSLSWKQCFPLLLQDREGINVIYGGHYDLVMMTKDMPWVVRERLYKGLPVKYAGYRIVYYRQKFLLLKDYRSGKSTVLYDVISFFQCSFVNACREYLGDDETLQRMQEMKLKRDTFTYDNENVDPYWRSEMEYLVTLMNTLRTLMADVDIKPRGWYGPGAVASAILNREGMKQYYGNVPDEITDIAERAYYGGRFEQFKVGAINRVYEYDIRSAYPSAITELPDFSRARWNSVQSPTRIARFGLYQVSWDIRFRPWTLGPFPWRDEKGNILFPLRGVNSWYWGVEVMAMIRTTPSSMYTIHQGWEPDFPRDVERPFGFVRDMYNNRAAMKAAGNPAQRALKLGMNSLYGKLAQSTGAKKSEEGWKKPGWHHILWAGWITAYTRAKLLEAIGKDQKSIVAIETDAIFSLKPLPQLTLGTALGEFEDIEMERILYIHSGVYYSLNNGVWKLKSRGVEAHNSHSADYWLDIFGQLPMVPQTITLTMRRFGTDHRQPKRFGKWYSHSITTNIPGAFSKRMHHPNACITCSLGRGSYREHYHFLSVPQSLIQSDWQESSPYAFPWRDDVKFKWRDVKGEAIEEPESIEWI